MSTSTMDVRSEPAAAPRVERPAIVNDFALVVATVELLNALLFQWLRLSLVRFLPAAKDDPVKLKSTLATIACLMVNTVRAACAIAGLPKPAV